VCNGIAVKEGDYFKKDGLSKYDSATEKKHKDFNKVLCTVNLSSSCLTYRNGVDSRLRNKCKEISMNIDWFLESLFAGLGKKRSKARDRCTGKKAS
jgi:hypothetical protein